MESFISAEKFKSSGIFFSFDCQSTKAKLQRSSSNTNNTNQTVRVSVCERVSVSVCDRVRESACECVGESACVWE